MYEAVADPYCYPDTNVLINRLDIRDPIRLAEFEAEISAQRAMEPLPAGKLDVIHYNAVHRHLFQDVYDWAGTFHTVRISKEDSMFCFPEHIGGEMERLFHRLKERNHFVGLSAEEFAASAACFLSTLNAILAFREGNGRAQMSFMTLLAVQAEYPLDLDLLDPQAFLRAMIAGFRGDELPLAEQILGMI